MSIEKVDICGAVLFMLTEFASLFVSLSCENCAVHDFDMEGQRRLIILARVAEQEKVLGWARSGGQQC